MGLRVVTLMYNWFEVAFWYLKHNVGLTVRSWEWDWPNEELKFSWSNHGWSLHFTSSSPWSLECLHFHLINIHLYMSCSQALIFEGYSKWHLRTLLTLDTHAECLEYFIFYSGSSLTAGAFLKVFAKMKCWGNNHLITESDLRLFTLKW